MRNKNIPLKSAQDFIWKKNISEGILHEDVKIQNNEGTMTRRRLKSQRHLDIKGYLHINKTQLYQSSQY